MRAPRPLMPWMALLAAATPALAAPPTAVEGTSALTILALYLSGLLFLLFEFFLFPGFGLPGLLGCTLIAANMYAVFHGYGSTVAWTVLMLQLVVGVGVTVAGMKILPHTAVGKAMTHETHLDGKAPSQPTLDPDLWVGKQGAAVGSLSPQGSVKIDGEELPAKAKRLIRAGAAVTVVAVEGSTLVVEGTQEA